MNMMNMYEGTDTYPPVSLSVRGNRIFKSPFWIELGWLRPEFLIVMNGVDHGCHQTAGW